MKGRDINNLILIDTSVLLEADKIDLFGELENFKFLGEPAVTKQVLNEIENLAKRNRYKRVARLALEFIKKRGVKIIDARGRDADESLLNAALDLECAVITNDEKLIKLLKQKNIRVIRVRQLKRLELV